MEIGQLIKQRRLELHLTLEDVGKAVGVGKSTVKKWEDGFIANMKRDKIASLASVLQLNPIVLMGCDIQQVEASDDIKQATKEKTNTIKIAGRDGSYIERTLTDDQLDLIKKMIDQLPNAEDL